MRRVISVVCCIFLIPAVCLAGKPLLLVTPAGAYRAEVVNGVPGPWVLQDVTVIIQGFDGPGDPPDPPVPPITDTDVTKVAAVSKTILTSKDEGTAAAAVVDSLQKAGLTGAKFKEALEMASPIVDTSLDMKGRFNAWTKAVLAITTDPAKIKAGLVSAWGIATSQLVAIQAGVTDKEQPLQAEALDFALIIQIIQMILDLLRNLGII